MNYTGFVKLSMSFLYILIVLMPSWRTKVLIIKYILIILTLNLLNGNVFAMVVEKGAAKCVYLHKNNSS